MSYIMLQPQSDFAMVMATSVGDADMWCFLIRTGSNASACDLLPDSAIGLIGYGPLSRVKENAAPHRFVLVAARLA